MTPDQFLLMKVLQAKQMKDMGCNIDLVDHFMKQEGTQEELRGQLKNVCAYVSPNLAAHLESICTHLEISKREFIEKALIDYIEKAEVMMSEYQYSDAKE